MVKMTVKIDTVDDAKQLAGICGTADFDIDLVSGRYVVDAKSVMGILSLDFSNPIELCADCEADNEFLNNLKPYMAE